MNNKIIEFIKTLSKNDKKTLIGKALKTTEEVGELAKAILPYENASGTLHRFVNREQILENAVDVMLCAMSIAYDLKYTDEEIEAMMLEKATKWSGIQAKEDKVTFPLPYEIHITVDLKKSERDVDQFKNVCRAYDLKPIIIELEKNGENIMNDVMTSSVHFGDNNSAIYAAESLVAILRTYNLFTSRVKIETVPWHPAAPIGDDEMPENSYFESHLRIVTTLERKWELEEIANSYDVHLSRNFFKKISDDEYIIMMTMRDDDTNYESFKTEIEHLKKILIEENFLVDKTEIEFAVYDTNVNHDIEWIK